MFNKINKILPFFLLIAGVAIFITMGFLADKDDRLKYEGCKIDTVYINHVDTVYFNRIDTVLFVDSVIKLNDYMNSRRIEKIRYYIKICENNPSQKKFLFGWIRRTLNE